mmetsp:Transcript_6251/g.14157  ORF Transcript_6251/g.14157 Transcript_6251/m.14157 type:complete len:231 (-) Transcript_6251:540-1232(-)
METASCEGRRYRSLSGRHGGTQRRRESSGLGRRSAVQPLFGRRCGWNQTEAPSFQGRRFGGALGRPSAGGCALSYLVRLCRAAHLLRGGLGGQEAAATCYGGGFHHVLGLQHQCLGHGLTQRRRGAARLWRLGLVEALGGDGGRDAATSRGGRGVRGLSLCPEFTRCGATKTVRQCALLHLRRGGRRSTGAKATSGTGWIIGSLGGCHETQQGCGFATRCRLCLGQPLLR